MKCGAIIMFCLGFISFGLIIACVAGNEWAKATYNKIQVQTGLWKRCEDKKCVILGDNVESWYQVVRALAVLTCLFTLIGTILALLLNCVKSLPSRYITWFFLCGTCAMVGSLVTFTLKLSSNTGGSLGWCYIVGWVGVVFNFFTFLFGFCLEKF